MGQTLRPVDFGTVLIVVAVVAAVVAVASFWGSGRIYSGLGRSGSLTMDERRAPAGAERAAGPEAREEIRQMLEAKSARREARGRGSRSTWTPRSTSLTRATGADPALREEVRQLVVARNERRLRHGEEPLDVDAEVERQLRDLGA